MQPTLTIIALSLWLIVFLGLTWVVFSLVSMSKENRFGSPLKGDHLVPASPPLVLVPLLPFSLDTFRNLDHWKRSLTVWKQRLYCRHCYSKCDPWLFFVL